MSLYLAYDADAENDAPAELTAEERRAVRIALSHVIGRMNGWRTTTYPLCRIVAALGERDLEKRDGAVVERSWSDGKQVMRRLGLEPKQLDQRWRQLRRRKEPFPDEVIAAFVPEELWPTIAHLIALGPDAVAEKAAPIFDDWAAGFLRNGEPRPRGPLSAASLGTYITLLWTLMRRICDGRDWVKSESSVFQEHWQLAELPRTPSPDDFDAEEAGWDRSAPPLLSVRRALRTINDEVERKRRYAQHRNHMFQELRDRAMLAILVVFGPRAEAVWLLDVDHYIPEHVFPDGSKGPALIVPRTKREKIEHTKALPPEVARWIEEYIAYIGAKPGEPLWRPGRKSIRHKRLDQQNIHDMLLRCLSPQCGQKNYSPHTLRHFASGVATLVGMEWIRERSDQFILGARGIPASPQTFSDVLLGHALHHIADRYRDMDSKQNREIWTKITVEGVWDWVWGDRGARKGPDLKLVAAAEQKVIATRTELDGLEARLTELEQYAQRPKALTEREGIQLVLQIITTTRALTKATSKHERALRELELAREVEVPIDDSVSEAPELPETEFEILRYEDEEEQPLVRTRLLPEEFRWCIGTDILPKSTLRHWMAGRLPCDLGDRRRMFELDAVGTDPDHPRKRYILVDKLDPSRYHVDAWERIMELCRRPEPRMHSRHRSRREQSLDGGA